MRKTEAERFTAIFDRHESMGKSPPWTNGLFNLLEWLTWNTHGLLGLSKTEYWKKAVKWAFEEDLEKLAHEHNSSPKDYLQQRLDFVELKIGEEQRIAEQSEKYGKPTSHLASPLEALRRAKYHSEDFLNKEFDVFWSLASDVYLDEFYRQFFEFNMGHSWHSHGNGGLFYRSFGLDPNKAQVDNVSYNPSANILVANELKLRSKKGDEQLLKYAWLFGQLKKNKAIADTTKLYILILGEKYGDVSFKQLVNSEIERSKSKTGLRKLLSEDEVVVSEIEAAKFASIDWGDLLTFNQSYLNKLNPKIHQVEFKLIEGFNRSLRQKAVFFSEVR